MPYWCGVAAPQNSELFKKISETSDAAVLKYDSGEQFNGWTVPDVWEVKRCVVSKNGEEIFDGLRHPLAVAAYSKSFQGKIEFEELVKHVHTRPESPEVFGYHCMWQYRPWDADWCLCVPHQEFENWTEGEYDVDLQTLSTSGSMQVAEARIEGKSDQTIVLNSHTCHPMQANDDIVGMAVAIELFRWLKTIDYQWSYRLILGPEHLGTVFYLKSLSYEERAKIVGCFFLEMPGTKFPLKFASTFLGDTVFDRAVRIAARDLAAEYLTVGWRKGAGNDETVWEAPGYEIPCVEMSRCDEQFAPYREYHTSADTLENVNWDKVDEFFHVMKEALSILERNAVMKRNFDGLICLSHPDYDLYLERPDPSVDKGLCVDSEKWGHLLDCLLRYFDENWSLLDIAEKHGLPFKPLADYIDLFAEKGLIILIPTLEK